MAGLGPLERLVMECVWQHPEPVTARAVHEVLTSSRRIAYTTVSTTLQRLVTKGMLCQTRDRRAYRYAALASRDQLVAELLSDALGVVDPGGLSLTRFVDELDPPRRAALRALLDRADDERPR